MSESSWYGLATTESEKKIMFKLHSMLYFNVFWLFFLIIMHFTKNYMYFSHVGEKLFDIQHSTDITLGFIIWQLELQIGYNINANFNVFIWQNKKKFNYNYLVVS